MPENMRELGVVKLVQLQPDGLIIKNSSGYFYDVSRRVQVGSLMITSRGIEAVRLCCCKYLYQYPVVKYQPSHSSYIKIYDHNRINLSLRERLLLPAAQSKGM